MTPLMTLYLLPDTLTFFSGKMYTLVGLGRFKF